MSKLIAVLCVLLLSCTAVQAQLPEPGGFRATVHLQQVGNAVVMVADTNRDGSVDQSFVLQREAGGASVSPRLIARANVQFEPGYVEIMGGGEIVELAIADTDVRRSGAPVGHRLVRYSGFGVAHNTGETGLAMPDAKTKSDAFTTAFCDAIHICADPMASSSHRSPRDD